MGSDTSTKQLAIDFPNKPSYRHEDYIVMPHNENVIERLRDVSHWQAPAFILEAGQGAGKTHIAHFWAHEKNACYLTPSSLQEMIADDAMAGDCFVIDDLEQYLADKRGEEDVFHLYNHCFFNKAYILITTSQPLASLSFHTADLRSRLMAAAGMRLESPDDVLLTAILAKLFSDYQIQIDPATLNYIVSRAERSVDVYRDIVARLDQKAFEEKRKITIPFIRQLLDLYQQGELYEAEQR